MRHKVVLYLKRLLGLFMAVASVTGLLAQSIPAEARDNAYIACLLDPNDVSWKSVVVFSGDETERLHFSGDAGAIPDALNDLTSEGMTGSLLGRYSFSAGDEVVRPDGGAQAMYNRSTGKWDIYGADGGSGSIAVYDTNTDADDRYPAALTFPPVGKSASESDINRAYTVGTTLVNELSQCLIYLNDNRSYSIYQADAIDYYLQMTAAVVTVPDGETRRVINANGGVYYVSMNSTGVCTVEYVGQYELINGEPNGAYSPASGSRNSRTRSFTYRMRKGYAGSSESDFLVFEDTGEENHLKDIYIQPDGSTEVFSDTQYINWRQLVWEGTWLYQRGVSYDNYGDLYSMDATESTIVSLLRDLLSSLRTSLGCYEISDLVFNEGTRNTYLYAYGVFPTSWYGNISKFYLVMSILAFSFLGISLIVMITKRAVMTAMPGMQASLMAGARDTLVALFLLACGYPLIYLALQLNEAIVRLFVTMNGNVPFNLVLMSGSGTLAGIVLQFAYFVIVIYINIFYILRALMIAALICIFPLCIMGLSFGKKGQDMAFGWVREFSANLFVQSIHALIFSFLMLTAGGLRGIETIVLTASLIPITKTFKALILGNGGGLVDRLTGNIAGNGLRMGSAAIGAAAHAVGGAANGIQGGIHGAVFGNEPSSGSSSTGLLDRISGRGVTVSSSESGTGGVNLLQEAKAIGLKKGGAAALDSSINAPVFGDAGRDRVTLYKHGDFSSGAKSVAGGIAAGVASGIGQNIVGNLRAGDAIIAAGNLAESALGAGIAVGLSEEGAYGAQMVGRGLSNVGGIVGGAGQKLLEHLPGDVQDGVSRFSGQGLSAQSVKALQNTGWYRNENSRVLVSGDRNGKAIVAQKLQNVIGVTENADHTQRTLTQQFQLGTMEAKEAMRRCDAFKTDLANGTASALAMNYHANTASGTLTVNTTQAISQTEMQSVFNQDAGLLVTQHNCSPAQIYNQANMARDFNGADQGTNPSGTES